MKVIFKNRDFTATIKPVKDKYLTVDRYSWSMNGGPKDAYLKIAATADKWEIMKLLRAPIEIYGDDGEIVWWGFINRVTVPIGTKQSLGLGLNEMYNYVTASYGAGDTAAASDTNSISEYGQKEIRLSTVNAESDVAENQRDLYLADHKGGVQETELNGGSQEISIECYGWNSTIGWKYYSNTGISDVANETQIAAIITDSGQFLQGSIIQGASGFTSSEFRDVNKSGLANLSELMAAGTDNVQPYLSYVDKDRYMHVYERTAQPSQADYLLREDGKLITKLGKVVPDQECKVAVWVKPKGAPETLDGFSTIGSFFIESAEYNVAQDKTTYKPAGAYEQIRLAKYIGAVSSGDGGGNNLTNLEGATIYNVINPTRYAETLELYQTVPKTLSPRSANMVWEGINTSRGNVISWPYDGDNWNIRLHKIGWYAAYFVLHGDGVNTTEVVSCKLNGLQPASSTGSPLHPVDSATERYGITEGYEVYVASPGTITMQMLEGTDGMNWRGTLQIIYKGT